MKNTNVIDASRRLRGCTRQLLKWGSGNFREFLWREPDCSPFDGLVCEMLLRRTQAATVDSVARRLLGRYSTPEAMAGSYVADIERIISPLGLYKVRAKALSDISWIITAEHDGEVPHDVAELMKMPHVGRYVANAVACFSFNQRRSIVDANIARLLNRLFGYPIPVEIHKADRLWVLMERSLPRSNIKMFNYALLDMAALVCRPKTPSCSVCPLLSTCGYASRDHQRFS